MRSAGLHAAKTRVEPRIPRNDLPQRRDGQTAPGNQRSDTMAGSASISPVSTLPDASLTCSSRPAHRQADLRVDPQSMEVLDDSRLDHVARRSSPGQRVRSKAKSRASSNSIKPRTGNVPAHRGRGSPLRTNCPGRSRVIHQSRARSKL